MLRFVNALAGRPAGPTRRSRRPAATGNADLKLAPRACRWPHVDAATVKGSVALAGNDVRISARHAAARRRARARVDFTQKGFAVAGASARVLGGDAQLRRRHAGRRQRCASAARAGQRRGLRRAAELGPVARIAGVAERPGAPTGCNLGFVHGRPQICSPATWSASASTCRAPLAQGGRRRRCRCASRRSCARRPRRAGARRCATALRFELGNVRAGAVRARHVAATRRACCAAASACSTPAPTPAEPASPRTSTLQRLDVDAWEAVLDQRRRRRRADAARAAPARARRRAAGVDAAAAPATCPTRSRCARSELAVGSRRLAQRGRRPVAATAASGAPTSTPTSSTATSNTGRRAAARPAAGAGRVYARLARLSPAQERGRARRDACSTQQPASVPALDIVVDDFELRGKRLGRLEIEAVNRTAGGRDGVREWRLAKLNLTMPEASSRHRHLGAPARRRRARRAAPRARWTSSSTLADSGALLERLGIGKAVRGGKGALPGQVVVARLAALARLPEPGRPGQRRDRRRPVPEGRAGRGAAARRAEPAVAAAPAGARLPRRVPEGFAFDNVTGDVKIERRRGAAPTTCACAACRRRC